jgi:hypothetical protein
MPLNLNELIKKAKSKGIKAINNQSSASIVRPWQHESTLYITKHKPNTNQTQTKHKANTKWRQTEHKWDTKQKQTKQKLNTKPNTLWNTNQTQTKHKANTKESFSTLVGLQRKILLFLYENSKATRSKTTEPLSLEHLAKQLNIRTGSIKTSLRRLQIKLFINRLEFKNGRNGWSRYEIPDDLFSELMKIEAEYKLNTKWTQTEHKPNTKVDTKPDTISASSSGININTTTTSDPKSSNNSVLPDNWQNLDIDPLNEIGFTATHLIQIASQNKLSPQIVQDSIYAFAFDLQENDKAKSIKGDPINFFMGILRNGRVYTFPSNYESPQDKAMRLYTEQLRAVNQKRESIEKEAANLAFNDWVGQLTEEQKIELLPEMFRRNANSKKLEKSKVLESSARAYFEKEIWPAKKNEIVKNTEKQPQNRQNQIPLNIEQEVPNVETE